MKELNKYEFLYNLLNCLKQIYIFSIDEESPFGKFYLIISDGKNFSIRKEISKEQYKLFERWIKL